jgi:dynein heavy chain, axonemal
MKLSRCDVCLSSAHSTQELAIEKALNQITEVWKTMRLDLHKYAKNGKDRSYILKSTDEITVLLDDNMMNLNSMSASRFSGPFIEQVRVWEKKLSMTGEVLEAWMNVQRKWMYLEGIFVGSDDIRLQLPEEARRFDTIDKAWVKLMQDTAKNTVVLVFPRPS